MQTPNFSYATFWISKSRHKRVKRSRMVLVESGDIYKNYRRGLDECIKGRLLRPLTKCDGCVFASRVGPLLRRLPSLNDFKIKTSRSKRSVDNRDDVNWWDDKTIS